MSDLAHPTDSGDGNLPFVRELFVLPPESAGSDDSPATSRPSLRVSGLSIDGFGALCGLDVDGLAEGMTVLVGPNEAGKSTIFDFLAAVLFGFPGRKADARFRAPVNGGRHGGRVNLVDDAGGQWLVERHGPPSKQLSVTRPDGNSGGEEDLARLLGGANGELFRAVFAVDLDDLNRLDGMSSDEVREVLFSSSILGQRRSAARAMKELEARRDRLVKPRQGGEANNTAALLSAARTDLAAARLAASRYAALRDEGTVLERQVAALRARREEVAGRERELGLLLRCWDALARRRELESELSGAPELSADEARRLGLRDELSRLSSQSSGHFERVRAFEQAALGRARLADSIALKSSELGEWARTLAASDDFDPDELRSRVQLLMGELTEAEADLRAARSSVAHARGEAEMCEAAEPTSPSSAESVEVVQRRIIKLKELRGRITEIDEMARHVERDADRDRARVAAASPSGGTFAPDMVLRTMTFVLCGVAALLAVATVLAVATRENLAAALLSLLAVGVATLAAWVARLRRKAAADRGLDDPGAMPTTSSSLATGAHDDDRRSTLAELRERAFELLGELGLERDRMPLSLVSAQAMIDEAELILDGLRRAESTAAQRAGASRRLADAVDASRAAEREVEAAGARLAAYVTHAGLPPVAPSDLPEIVDKLAQLSERTRAVARIDADLADSIIPIEGFETDVDLLVASFAGGRTPSEPSARWRSDESGIRTALQQMASDLDALHDRRARRRDLETRIADADHDIVRLLGEGPRARSVHDELGTGRVLEWETERESVRAELEELERQYERALREHEGMTRQLHDLACSGDVPMLEQRCAELEESLRGIVRQYVEASGARFLLQRTLKRFEEQRQPAVLNRAGEHFARVTGGRYVRLGVDSAPDGSKATVRAICKDGRVVEATDLSRGTMEQLYLCLRLGLAESFADRYSPLPLVLDDVLVNFDPARQEAVARELATAARSHQVLMLTCHPHVADLLARVGGETETRIVELAPA